MGSDQADDIITTAVNFSVRVNTETDDVVCVVGSSAQLGEWDHEKAILLEKQFRYGVKERL